MRNTVKQKLQQLASLGENRVLLAGYGSLLSAYSRHVHSQISAPGLSVTIRDWSRSWITRAYHESQTYVGAIKDKGESFNALLVAVDVEPDFLQRERDYRFTKIELENIELDKYLVHTSAQDGQIESNNTRLDTDEVEVLRASLEKHPVYLCESLSIHTADEDHPVNYSYIATCLSGCAEIWGRKGVNKFMQQTKGWSNEHFNNDLKQHRYPRAAVEDLSSFDIEDLIRQQRQKR